MAEKVSKGKRLEQSGSVHTVIDKVKRLAISKRPRLVGDGVRVAYLPDEVLLRVFLFLDARSLLACASTCKRWEWLANDNVLWKKLYCLYFGQEQPPSPLCVEQKHWKQRFVKQAKKKRDRGFMKLIGGRQPCGFAYHAESHLRRLCNKFRITLTTRAGKVYEYSERARTYGPFAILLQWYNLGEFPVWKEVMKIEVFSSTPVLMSNTGKMLTKGLKQKCLVLRDEQLHHLCVGSCNPVGMSDNEISYIGLQRGILIGLWQKTMDIAFVTVSLHTYELLNKCLLSTSDNVFNSEHVVKRDDVSRFYGLQNYEFHVQLVCGDSFNVFNFEINSDVMDMRQDSATVSYRVKNPLRVFAFEEDFLAWKTDLFKGKIPGLVFLTLTAIDFNKDVIFHVTQPAKCEVLNEVSTDFESSGKSGLTLTCFNEPVGKGQLILTRHYSCGRFARDIADEGFYIDALEVTFNTKFINEWFGTHY